MSDLVKRLRERRAFERLIANYWLQRSVKDPDCQEAADRIEALERELYIANATIAIQGLKP